MTSDDGKGTEGEWIDSAAQRCSVQTAMGLLGAGGRIDGRADAQRRASGRTGDRRCERGGGCGMVLRSGAMFTENGPIYNGLRFAWGDKALA